MSLDVLVFFLNLLFIYEMFLQHTVQQMLYLEMSKNMELTSSCTW